MTHKAWYKVSWLLWPIDGKYDLKTEQEGKYRSREKGKRLLFNSSDTRSGTFSRVLSRGDVITASTGEDGGL